MMVTDCGLSPAEAIHASSWNPACLLGREADLGSIEKDKIADIIALPENPLDGIEALHDVFFVMKDGRICRNDRRAMV